MDVYVRFRFNKQTGEVEEFLVEAPDSGLPDAEHNRRHDDLASAIGRLLDRLPLLQEITPEERTDLTERSSEQHETGEDEQERTGGDRRSTGD